MKTILLLVALLVTSSAMAEDLSQHPFFKHLIGKWEASGDLKGEADNVVKLTEEWTGKATAEGGFIIEGKRQLNDGKQSFKWTMTHNVSTDSYEVVHVTDGDEAGAIRFEGHISDVTLSFELRAAIGTNGSITMVDAFADDTKRTLTSQVTMTGDAGNTTLSGTVTHKRVE